MLILLGIEDRDGEKDIDYLVRKIVNLRIFDDEQGVMNRAITDVDGDILVVSQFTLMADTRKGNRPSYLKASKPEIAVPLYEAFVGVLQTALGKPVPTGVFGVDMQVGLVNDGPVTIWIDTQNL